MDREAWRAAVLGVKIMRVGALVFRAREPRRDPGSRSSDAGSSPGGFWASVSTQSAPEGTAGCVGGLWAPRSPGLTLTTRLHPGV